MGGLQFYGRRGFALRWYCDYKNDEELKCLQSTPLKVPTSCLNGSKKREGVDYIHK